MTTKTQGKSQAGLVACLRAAASGNNSVYYSVSKQRAEQAAKLIRDQYDLEPSAPLTFEFPNGGKLTLDYPRNFREILSFEKMINSQNTKDA